MPSAYACQAGCKDVESSPAGGVLGLYCRALQMRVGSRVSRLYCCKTKVPAARISVVRGSDLRGALFAFACRDPPSQTTANDHLELSERTHVRVSREIANPVLVLRESGKLFPIPSIFTAKLGIRPDLRELVAWRTGNTRHLRE